MRKAKAPAIAPQGTSNRRWSVRRTRWPEPAKRHQHRDSGPGHRTALSEGSAGLPPRRRPRIATVSWIPFSASSRDRYILPRFPVRTCGAAFPCVRPRNALTRRSGPPRRKAENREQLSTSRHGSPESGTERIKIGQGWQRCRRAKTWSNVPARAPPAIRPVARRARPLRRRVGGWPGQRLAVCVRGYPHMPGRSAWCQGFRATATRQLGLSCLRRPPWVGMRLAIRR